MNSNDILNLLRENKEFFKTNYGVEKIGLFGSYAKNEQNENSDVDILVDMPSNFDYYYELKDFLEKKINKKVDLGMEKNMRLLIKKYVEKEIIYV